MVFNSNRLVLNPSGLKLFGTLLLIPILANVLFFLVLNLVFRPLEWGEFDQPMIWVFMSDGEELIFLFFLLGLSLVAAVLTLIPIVYWLRRKNALSRLIFLILIPAWGVILPTSLAFYFHPQGLGLNEFLLATVGFGTSYFVAAVTGWHFGFRKGEVI